MKKLFNLLIIFTTLNSFAFSLETNSKEDIDFDKSTIIDILINNTNLDSLRNEDGLIPINDYVFLLSMEKEGDPAIIVSKYIIDTYSMKFFLIPFIEATNNVDFHNELDFAFNQGLEEYREIIQSGDLVDFCSKDENFIVMKLDITIRKEYFDEDLNLLFSSILVPSLCRESKIASTI